MAMPTTWTASETRFIFIMSQRLQDKYSNEPTVFLAETWTNNGDGVTEDWSAPEIIE